MTGAPSPPPAPLDEFGIDLETLCRLAGIDTVWVCQRVAEGLLAPSASHAAAQTTWRFDGFALHRVRRMVALERDFEAVPELAALVADLEEELRALRQRKAAGSARG